jgi:hypothetical protein
VCQGLQRRHLRGGAGTHSRAKAFLFAASRIASYAQLLGIALDPAVVLHPSVIERFSIDGDMSPMTRRTLRTNLRSLSGSHVEVLGRYSNLGDQGERVRCILEMVPNGPRRSKFESQGGFADVSIRLRSTSW